MQDNKSQNYWVFGLFTLSGILGTRIHDVSETDPFSETSCFLVPRLPHDGKCKKKTKKKKHTHTHSNSECDTPLSETDHAILIGFVIQTLVARRNFTIWDVMPCKLMSLCFTNYALRHEGVWGSGCIDPHSLDLGTSWR
jgi:hypothetical protein